MVARSQLLPLSLALGILVLTLVSVSSLPGVRACINPPASCTVPDFELRMESTNAVVNQGNPTLALEDIYGFSNAYFSGNVGLNLTTAPNLVNGPTLTLSNPVLSFIPGVFRDSWVDVTASLNTPLGNYTVTVTGTGGNVTHTTSFVLTVAPPIPPDDFTVALYPIPSQFQTGGQSDVTIQVFRKGPPHMVPIDLTVLLTLTITPSNGLTAKGFPGSAYIGAYDGIGTTFTVQSSSSTAPGVYTLNATGTNYQRSQSLSHSAIATITLTAPISPNPSPGSSSPQPASRLNELFSVIAAIMSRPIVWTIITGFVTYMMLSLTATVIIIRRNHSKRRQAI